MKLLTLLIRGIMPNRTVRERRSDDLRRASVRIEGENDSCLFFVLSITSAPPDPICTSEIYPLHQRKKTCALQYFMI